MVILGTRNKITDFLMILAWASPFNVVQDIFKQFNSSNSGENIAISYVVAVTSKTISYPIKERNKVIYLFQVGLGCNGSHF